jgi:hypothetical protein
MKWRTMIVGAVTLPVLFSMVGCGGKSELSRSKAEKLIQASAKFTPGEYKQIDISSSLVQMGLEQGYWTAGPPSSGFSQVGLTEKGKRLFAQVLGGIWVNDRDHSSLNIKVAEPLPRVVVEVTGVADGPGFEGPAGTIKDVQFTWKWDWDAVPKELKTFLGPEPKPSKGEALLKLYDDGWRVEELKVD